MKRVASHDAFQNAELTTTFIDKHSDSLFTSENERFSQSILPVMTLLTILKRPSHLSESDKSSAPWQKSGPWRCNSQHRETIDLLVKNEVISVMVTYSNDELLQIFKMQIGQNEFTVEGVVNENQIRTIVNGHKTSHVFSAVNGEYTLFNKDTHISFSVVPPSLGEEQNSDSDAALEAPMNGTIVALLVEPNAPVEKGQPILVMEAMKMEHTITAPQDGAVESFFYQPGELVDGGATVLSYQPKSAGNK